MNNINRLQLDQNVLDLQRDIEENVDASVYMKIIEDGWLDIGY